MSIENLENRLNDVYKNVFQNNCENYNDDWTAADIESWDSMNHLNLIMSLNEEFNISIEFEDMIAIEKIGDIRVILEKYL